MIDVVVFSLCFADRLFDGMKLLGYVDNGAAFIEHFDDAAEVSFSLHRPRQVRYR
jgi:hypothetical protein